MQVNYWNEAIALCEFCGKLKNRVWGRSFNSKGKKYYLLLL